MTLKKIFLDWVVPLATAVALVGVLITPFYVWEYPHRRSHIHTAEKAARVFLEDLSIGPVEVGPYCMPDHGTTARCLYRLQEGDFRYLECSVEEDDHCTLLKVEP